MNITSIFILIICILVFDYLLETGLSILNGRYASPVLPKKLTGIYSEDKYAESLQYQKANRKFSYITSGFTFLLTLVFFLAGGFGWLDHLLRNVTENSILLALLYFGIIGLIMTLFHLPFEWYDTFVIEELFGFNKKTRRLFWIDQLKSLLLSAVFGCGILALIIWIYTLSPAYFWLTAWSVTAVISIFISMFYSKIIAPMFNKQTPLPEGELRTAIKDFSKKAGFQLKNIFVIDGSKRSAKSNAYFTGFGRQKRIVLYDTLIEKHSSEELVAILAHEVGHYKKNHILKGLAVSLLQSLLMFFLLGLFLNNDAIAQAMGAQASFHINIIAFGLLYSPISLIFGLAGNIFSRKYEFQADRFAGENTDPVVMQDALKKLSLDNLSNLQPHPLYVFFHYSHPPVLQRLEKLEKPVTGDKSA